MLSAGQSTPALVGSEAGSDVMSHFVEQRAVVLASGGVDSTVVAAVARRDGYELALLTIAYGQRHAIEVERAGQIAAALKAHSHRVIKVDLGAFGGSALTADIPVPKNRPDIERSADVPVTYVPGRNLVFLSLAAAYAETIGALVVYFGANVLDYSGYPDCRPEFIKAFETTVRLGTKMGMEGRSIEVRAPLLMLTKAEIIRLGAQLSVPFHLTHSCYDPIGVVACGQCDSCLIRRKGFAEAGVADPIPYVVL